MSESSPEAVIAGQAAAAAVEEVQGRQALAEDVTRAVVDSSIAEETAQEASQVAAMAAGEVAEAAQTAAMAAGMAGGAAEVAETAQETADASIDYAQRAYEIAVTADQKMDAFRAELLERLQPASGDPESNVSEVPVNDGSTGSTDTATTDTEGSESGEHQSRTGGRRVRRGRRN